MLACLTILLATVAVWVHQVAFNTDRFTGLVANVIDEPGVIAPLSAAVSEQVVVALDVQTRIAGRLPDVAKSLAPAITLAIQDGIASRLQVALARPQVQALLLKTVSIAHTRVMNLLRGNSDAVSVVDGYVTIEVLPLVQAALTELQSVGLLPDGVQIPDLTTSEAPGVLVQRLSTALGVTLPADFGTIRLMPADRLLARQTAVRAFDIIVVLLIVLSFVLVALAIWLAATGDGWSSTSRSARSSPSSSGGSRSTPSPTPSSRGSRTRAWRWASARSSRRPSTTCAA